MTTPYYAGQTLTAAALNAIVPQTSVLATAQTIGSTSPVQVGSFSADLAEGVTYTGYAWFTVDANTGGTGEFRWTGPADPTLLNMTILTQQLATADAYL